MPFCLGCPTLNPFLRPSDFRPHGNQHVSEPRGSGIGKPKLPHNGCRCKSHKICDSSHRALIVGAGGTCMVLLIVTLPVDPQCDRMIFMMGLFRYTKIRVSLLGIFLSST